MDLQIDDGRIHHNHQPQFFHFQFTLYLLLLITEAYSYNIENTSFNFNVTTLYPTNKTITRHEKENEPSNLSPQTWKLEATFVASNLTEGESKNKSINKEEMEKPEKKEEMTDFKPSQHLGSFFDDDIAEVIKNPIPRPVIKKPSSGFSR